MSRITKLVRKVMRNFGRQSIWNNKYKSCTTVKCYLHRESPLPEPLRQAIRDELIRAGYNPQTHFSFDMNYSPTTPSWSSFIVRIPVGVE